MLVLDGIELLQTELELTVSQAGLELGLQVCATTYGVTVALVCMKGTCLCACVYRLQKKLNSLFCQGLTEHRVHSLVHRLLVN